MEIILTDEAMLRLQIYESLRTYVKGRLFISPNELHGLFDSCPLEVGSAYFVFTKSGGDTPYDEINPRQSFRWSADKKYIERFENLDSLYKSLGISAEARGPMRSTKNFRAAIEKAEIGYCFIDRSHIPSPVSVLISQKASNHRRLEIFFEILMPYLESYRKGTLHCLNDTYRTRDDELESFASSMSPSAAETAKRLLDSFSKHPRFGINGFSLLKYTNEHKWIALYSRGSDLAAAALNALGTADDSSDSSRNPEDFDVIRSRKMLGLVVGDTRIVLIPFVRIHPPLGFRPVPTINGFEIEPTYDTGQSRLTVGDLVVGLAYDGSPPQAVIHSLVYYRNYYFDVYFPALLARANEEIFNRIREIRDQIGKQTREDTASNPWEPFIDLCASVLPTVCSADNLSVVVSIYDVATHALIPAYHWSPIMSDPRGDLQGIGASSLRKGARGLAASVFFDGDKPFLLVDDVSKERRRSKHATDTDEPHGEAGSQFLRRLHHRSAAIGMVTFTSPEVRGFNSQLQKRMNHFVHGLEDFLREFLATHDAKWLSITAGAYHNLHELREECFHWSNEDHRQAVLNAIKAFDQAFEGSAGTLRELQDYFNEQLRRRILVCPASVRVQVEASARLRFRFHLADSDEIAQTVVSRTTIELVKRAFKNLVHDFPLTGSFDVPEIFMISIQKKPLLSIRLRQEQNRPFPKHYFSQLGYQPIHEGDRLHHGIFLCSAIARYLGGFAWISNSEDTPYGIRSVIDLIIPVGEAGA
jgi:hypothetical protein